MNDTDSLTFNESLFIISFCPGVILYESEYVGSPGRTMVPVYLFIKYRKYLTKQVCHLMKLFEKKEKHDTFTTENRIT